MKRIAIERAKHRHDRALRALETLARAGTGPEAEEAWWIFLRAADEIFNQLRAGSRGHPKSWDMTNRMVNEQKNDPLVQYMKQAHDGDRHGLLAVTVDSPPSYGVMTPHGAILGMEHHGPPEDAPVIKVIDPMTGTWGEPNPQQMWAQYYPAELSLVAAENKGVKFAPPAVHAGQPIVDCGAHGCGQLFLAYLRDRIAEAETLCDD